MKKCCVVMASAVAQTVNDERMSRIVTFGLGVLSVLSVNAMAVVFHAESVTTDTRSDTFAVGNLITGIGLTDGDPPEHLFEMDLWVTRGAPTFSDNYFDHYGPVHLVFDLGEERNVGSIYIWPYAYRTGLQSPNRYQGNTLRDFELRFNTEIEGTTFSGVPDFLGTGRHGPTLPSGVPLPNDVVQRQAIPLYSVFRARYVQMTIINNYHGFLGAAGGDRCGASEIWFDSTRLNPTILSFESDGLLTWSNAYPDAIASIERLTDMSTTGSAVTVTETLAVSDGSATVYNYTVEHLPIVPASVTISDGTYTWNDVTGSSDSTVMSGVVDYLDGRVFAVYLSHVSVAGTTIDVVYSYRPVSTHQEWLSVYSELQTSEVTKIIVDRSENTGLFRVGNGGLQTPGRLPSNE